MMCINVIMPCLIFYTGCPTGPAGQARVCGGGETRGGDERRAETAARQDEGLPG